MGKELAGRKKRRGRKLCGSFLMDGNEMGERREWDLKNGVLGVVERGNGVGR